MPSARQKQDAKKSSKWKQQVEQLRTKVWYQAVQVASGLTSPYAIAQWLKPDDETERRRWFHYRSGSRSPPGGSGADFVVDVVEARLGGTASYYRCPMWALLLGHTFSAHELDQMLASLNPRVRKLLMRPSLSPNGNLVPWNFGLLECFALIEQRTFDAFLASVLLVAKSTVIGQPLLRVPARTAYIELQAAMDDHPVIGPFCAELCGLLDRICTAWGFPTNQMRVEYAIVTHPENVRKAMEAAGGVRIPWPESEKYLTPSTSNASPQKARPSRPALAHREISEALWQRIQPLLPPPSTSAKGGRPRLSDEAALNGVVHVLRTGIAWQDLSLDLGYGSGETCLRRLRDWHALGIWERMQEILTVALGATLRLDFGRVGVATGGR